MKPNLVSAKAAECRSRARACAKIALAVGKRIARPVVIGAVIVALSPAVIGGILVWGYCSGGGDVRYG